MEGCFVGVGVDETITGTVKHSMKYYEKEIGMAIAGIKNT